MINETTNNVPTTEESSSEQADQSEVVRGGFSLGERLRSPRTLVSFAIALAIVVFAFRSLNIKFSETWQYMRGANIPIYLLGFASFYLTFPLRAIRWRLLLVNAGVPVQEGRRSWASPSALMEYIFLSWFANCIVPAKLGDAYRAYLLKHNGGVSFSSTFGTIFAERLLDMLALFALLCVSGAITFGGRLPPQTQLIFVSGVVLVLLILAGLAGMRWFSPLVRRFIPQRLHRVYHGFETAALRSFQPRVLPLLVLLTAGVWLLEGFRLYFVIQSLGSEGLHLSLAVIIFVALSSSLLTVLPFTPAGLGLVESAVVTVLLLFAVNENLGGAVALLDRTINFWSIIVFGFVAYLLSKRK